VVSGRGLCDRLITRPEESYRMWWVTECDLETLWMRRPWPTGGGAVVPNNKYFKGDMFQPFNHHLAILQ
jgi:hypothetical protein